LFLLTLFGIVNTAFFVIYIVVFTAGTVSIPYKHAQIICCFFPPLALQIGCGAFLKSYHGIDISLICGIMAADIVIYTLLAWYFSQVWPSKVGVHKPFYFPLSPSYWFPKQRTRMNGPTAGYERTGSHDSNEGKEMDVTLEDGAPIPTEKVNESLTGPPTVVVHKLRKTFGQQVSVNDLSFNMYENQIFALLGHNGAGKVATCVLQFASAFL
jgi:ABC-type multidrug transport system fused ATPase/permease subunit